MTTTHKRWVLLLVGMLQPLPAAVHGEPVAQDTLPTVNEIVERYVEAVGGREAITRFTTRVMRGKLITDLPSRTPPRYEESAVEIRSALPDAFVMTTHGADGTYVDGFDGTIRWSMDGLHVTRHARLDRRFAWFVNPRNALRLWEHFPGMTLRGTVRLEEGVAFVIDIDQDRSHALHFDAQTGLLARLGYNRELHDYREVDGVKVPFRMVMSRKGGSSTYVFDTIEHNVRLDEALFAMPDSLRAAVRE